MTRKDQLIDELNKTIKVVSNSFLAGIVRTTEKSGERINYDKDSNPIVFDDRYDMFSYHKVLDEQYDEIQSRGKFKTYVVTANINLIIYGTSRELPDNIVAEMSKLKDVTVKKVDHDSLKIFRQETSKKDFDLSKYIFMVNYDLRYRSSECTNTCR
jgi:hypothetical protein